ncbi:hypothetical protein HELRODRAFT_187749 [Helobdella robusta]|uniref:Glycerate kinase n=1 Tax=Helobdella robusta TaxID=6412 RepID=T1FPC6_HELRO|nr:hypothetical protein HELRODRAFT_187749 [Helobdella robusta]ESO07082.1 hypothetical protein HELRODRAFT_187749 [Helobdella robusta]
MEAVKLRNHAFELFNVSLKSVTPCTMMLNSLKISGNILSVGDQSYVLNNNVHIVAFGKAVIGMVKTAEDILGDHIVDGIASIPSGIQSTLKSFGKWDFLPSVTSKVKLIEGSTNNCPDENSLRAAQEIKKLVTKCGENDIVLVLISGGGSALLPSPTPPLTLQELSTVTQMLSKKGATIQQLNTVRKHLEELKGGGLAKAAFPAQVISLILSDVVNNDLNFIASGPTSQDFTTPQQCFDLLENFDLLNCVPQSVFTVLNDRSQSEEFKKDSESEHTLKKSVASFHCRNVHNVIIGSNVIALNSALKYADSLGYGTYLLSSSVTGDAEERGQMFALLINYICRTMYSKNKPDQLLVKNEFDLLHRGLEKSQLNELCKVVTEYDQCSKPVCILAAGETTVNVVGQGMGGRNQHMVLSAAIELNKLLETDVLSKYAITFLSAGTDGQDGPTDAAGASCDQTLIKQALKLNLKAEDFLRTNDSYTFFSKVDAGRYLLKTGLTGTNVMDLQIILISPIS